MQQIERYGVIALVFLLVTIVAVSFWGDAKSPGFWSRLSGRGVPKKEEVLVSVPPATAERALDQGLPLSPSGSPDLAEPNAAIVNDPVARDLAANAGTPVPVTAPVIGGTPPAPVLAHGQPGTTIQPPVDSIPALSAPSPSVATQRAPVAATATEYVVQKGDSLVLIAARKLGDANRWQEIAGLNGGLDPKRLLVGKKIKLPAGTASHAASAALVRASTPTIEKPAAKKTSPTPKSSATYVVRGGDTLRSIAERKLGDAGRWKEIVALNAGLDPSRLAVGRSIHLPLGQSRPVVASAAPVGKVVREDRPYVR